ncbi:MAG: helix-turn-helix domain-containing protein [Pseudomonadota bacterium]
MQRTSFAKIDCPIAQCLEAVGDWWSMMIIRDAMLGVQRFEDFQDRLGIARNILSQRLKKLVAEGVLRRREYQQRPRRVEYVLTGKGRDLFPLIVAMIEWGRKWGRDDLGKTQQLAFPDTGNLVRAVFIDQDNQRPIDLSSVVLMDTEAGKPVRPATRR